MKHKFRLRFGNFTTISFVFALDFGLVLYYYMYSVGCCFHAACLSDVIGSACNWADFQPMPEQESDVMHSTA